MKKFSFSLEKVLGYKEQIEENLRNEHAVAVQNVRKKEKEIEELQQKKASNVEKMREAKTGPISSAAVLTYENWFSILEQKTDIKKQELETLKDEEVRCREKVIEAKKERKSIDLLKEKKIKEYRKEEQKEQEMIIEEFVTGANVSKKNKI